MLNLGAPAQRLGAYVLLQLAQGQTGWIVRPSSSAFTGG